jgi:hypothetical protein
MTLLVHRTYIKQHGRTAEVGAYNYTAAALRDYPSSIYIGSCEIQECVLPRD